MGIYRREGNSPIGDKKMVVNTGIDPKAKTWTEPQLTILTRNNPEEMVLALCKGLNGTGNVNNADRGCQYTGNCSNHCDISVNS